MFKDFPKWIAEVDTLISSQIGISAYDLPEIPSRYWEFWADGVTPEKMAYIAIKYAEEYNEIWNNPEAVFILDIEDH